MPRTYQPRSYGLVPMPALPDPMQTLSGMMSLQRQMEDYGDRQKERTTQKLVEEGLAASKGDWGKTADYLEAKGQALAARRIRDQQAELHAQSLQGMLKRVDDHKTVYGQAQQLVTEVQAKPETYTQLRPRFVELAAQVNPELVQGIPEAYSPDGVASMASFIQQEYAGATKLARAAALAKQAQDAARAAVDDSGKRASVMKTWGDAAREALEGQPDELAEQIRVGFRMAGAPEAVLYPTAKPKEATPVQSIQQGLARAQEAGDTAGVLQWLGLQRKFADAGRERTGARAGADPDVLKAIEDNPGLFWEGLTDSGRMSLMGPLARRGFNFKKSVEGIDQKTLATRRLDSLRQLEMDLIKGTLSDEQYDDAKARLETFYSSLGLSGAKRNTGTGAAAASRDAVLPPDRRRPGKQSSAATAAPDKSLFTQGPGIYTMDDGTKWRLSADGTITPAR